MSRGSCALSVASGLVGGVVGTGLVLGAVAYGQPQLTAPVQNQVVAREIILVDRAQKPRALIRCDEDQNPQIVLAGANVWERIFLGFRKPSDSLPGSASIWMTYGDSPLFAPRAELSAESKGASLSLRKDISKLSAVVECDDLGGQLSLRGISPSIDVSDPDRKNNVSIGRTAYVMKDGSSVSTSVGSVRVLQDREIIWKAP